MKYRYEDFGGIIASEDPPFLAFVDRDYMREVKKYESPLWAGPEPEIGLLSSPLEVHIALTNRCSAGCPHCYMDSTQMDDGELSTAEFKKALKILADMKVFHVALGGGEALEREDLFEIAEYCRTIGLVPNLTTSGRGITLEIAQQMTVFGQVNISMDGVGELYSVFRGQNMYEIADKAIEQLLQAGVPTGINCVLGRRNFAGLEDLFAYAEKRGVNEIEILRYKPAGRSVNKYLDEATTHKQNISLIPHLAKLSEQYHVTTKIDCSFVPMLCYHNPPLETLMALATYGCEAGNVLLGVRSDGKVAGCSFLCGNNSSVFDYENGFTRKRELIDLSSWTKAPPEPCRDCDYLSICKGGCRAVSLAVNNDLFSPDPHCPKVIDFQNEINR